MKTYLPLLFLILVSCQNKSDNNPIQQPDLPVQEVKSTENEPDDDAEKRFRDSMYHRESDNYISTLEEIADRDSNAYKLTITAKNGKTRFSKILNTRPQFSAINFCNDLYTVVGFPCGGPCYAQAFVFTDEKRPYEQYSNAQSVADHPSIITHIRLEEFENLIVHNFENGKELVVENPDINWALYGRMDTLYMQGNNLKITYQTDKKKTRTKTVSLEKILH